MPVGDLCLLTVGNQVGDVGLLAQTARETASSDWKATDPRHTRPQGRGAPPVLGLKVMLDLSAGTRQASISGALKVIWRPGRTCSGPKYPIDACYPDTNLPGDFFSTYLRGPHELNDLLGLGASCRRSALVFPFGLSPRNAFPLPL